MELDHIRIVLVETTHPGNIGAAARAMKVMGLSQLYLVRPRQFPDPEATARSSGAEDILQNAVICQSIEQAITNCDSIYGTSGRTRNLQWATLSPRKMASHLASERKIRNVRSDVAILFGRESRGLTNEELDVCHYRVDIPSNSNFHSLNLAAAVQVIAYECRMAYMSDAGSLEKAISSCDEDFATGEQVLLFYEHLEETLIKLNFLDTENPRLLMRRLKRLFARVHLYKSEVAILRGILSSISNKLN